MRVSWEGSDQGQRDGVCGRGGLLQGQQRHRQCGQRGERSPQHQVLGGSVDGVEVVVLILVISSKLFHPRLLAQTSLRNILGTKNLHEVVKYDGQILILILITYQILSDRDSISNSMQTILDDATTAWGIKVERVEM